jgi:hypothetical protein
MSSASQAHATASSAHSSAGGGTHH